MEKKQIRKWQDIIWREWRNCRDQKYADQVIELVADAPVGLGTKITIVLLDLLAGMTVGLLLGFLFTSEWLILRQFLWAGGVVGGVRGYLVGRDLSWRNWLDRLAFNLPTHDPSRGIAIMLGLSILGSFIFSPFFLIVIIGLFWALGGLIHLLNRGRDSGENPLTYQAWYFWWRGRPQPSELETTLDNLFQARKLSVERQIALGVTTDGEASQPSELEFRQLKRYSRSVE